MRPKNVEDSPYIVGCRSECCYLVIVMREKVIIFETLKPYSYWATGLNVVKKVIIRCFREVKTEGGVFFFTPPPPSLLNLVIL